MKIALIGASGFIGSALLREALAREHEVIALVTRPQGLIAQERLSVLKADVQDTAALTGQLRGVDAVLTAFSGHAQADTYDYYVRGFDSILAAATAARAPRLLVVGGAASLEVAPGRLLFDSPDFPAEYKATAAGAKTALEHLRAQTAQPWTMLSPAALIAPGERTGHFRLGGDQLLVDAEGNSRISVEDYAVALLDELEHPRHPNQRFTLAY